MKDNWVNVQLSDMVECLDGQRRPIKKEVRELIKGNIPYYGASGIIDFVNDYIFEEDLILLGEDGENVISRNLPLAFKISGKNWVNNHAHVLRAKSGYDTDFLVYLLENKDYTDIVSGSAQPKINQNNLMKLIFKVPKFFPQQKKIAKILSTCDEVIEKTEAAIAKYKAIKQGMMHDLFTRGIDTATGKLRPSYQEAPELYKESALGMIPKEWEVKRFSEYFKLISYGFTNPMPEYEDGPYMITAANVIGGKIDYNSARKTSKKLFDTILTNKSRPKINDLLLTKDGTLGRVAIVDKENICINQSVAIIRFNDGINPFFFKYLLETSIYQKKMLDDAGGSTIKHIYITIVDKMLLSIPKGRKEKNCFVEILNNIDEKLKAEESSLSKYKKIKEGLMQDLLTGRVEVSI